MRMINGAWQCQYCNAELAVPADRQPKQMLEGKSGRRNVRVLILDGQEIHRCVLGDVLAPGDPQKQPV